MTSDKPALIKTIYFYLVSVISLMMIAFPAADLINLGLKTWIFPKADMDEYTQVQVPCPLQYPTAPDMKQPDRDMQIANCEANAKYQLSPEERKSIQRQRDLVRDLSFIIVGIPLFAYHWKTIRRESRDNSKK